MKYMFIVGKLAYGGSERVLSILANQLVKVGAEVVVLAYNACPDEYILEKKVKKYYMPEINYSYSLLWKKDKGVLFRCLKYMRELIQREEPDFLIPFYYSIQKDVIVATLFIKKRIVATIRNNPKQVPYKRATRWFRNLMCFFSYKVYTQNESQITYFPRFMRKKFFALENPVADIFTEYEKGGHFDENGVRFVSVGRLVPQKNHRNLLDAFQMLLERYPNSRLEIYGDDQLRGDIEDYIKELKIDDAVECKGRAEDIARILTEKDVFVLSSDYEGMPNALMEALTVGLPCISTDCPTGPAELIENGITGLLVPIKSPERLAEAMQYMIEHQEEAIRMGKRAREFMLRRYNSEQITKQFCDYLRE